MQWNAQAMFITTKHLSPYIYDVIRSYHIASRMTKWSIVKYFFLSYLPVSWPSTRGLQVQVAKGISRRLQIKWALLHQLQCIDSIHLMNTNKGFKKEVVGWGLVYPDLVDGYLMLLDECKKEVEAWLWDDISASHTRHCWGHPQLFSKEHSHDIGQ